MSISEDQACVLLKAAGYKISKGKAGLCRIDTLMVKRPDDAIWDLSCDFRPESYKEEEGKT